MTVCTAPVFFRTYDIATKDFGPAIVTASDRMLTDIDLGIEYQGSRYKGTVLAKQHMILVSGDVTIHSAMLLQLAPTLAASQATTTLEMAVLRADCQFVAEHKRILPELTQAGGLASKSRDAVDGGGRLVERLL
jgi:hypothetical protein